MARLIVLQHIERECPGLFLKIALDRGMTNVISRLDLGHQIPQVNKGDILLILGGPMGIQDINSSIYPWLIKELDLIKDLLIRDIGIIGVCLGAQLLAHAAGGGVKTLLDKDSSKPYPEVGWDPIYPNDQRKIDCLNTFLQPPLNVLHWHGDRIFLPEKAELIASSERCKEQLFRIGSFAYGLQFHAEINNEMVEKWIYEDKNFIRSSLGIDAEAVLQKQQRKFGDLTLQRRILFLDKIFDLIISA
tara:strand:- start:17643 stop:18380 length:738 start_codon:yes stop_codon:yes gene_type:complete